MKQKLSLDEIRQTELHLLSAFHDFCMRNGLQYSLCGGSLLGAVRHKGFIPWDDDIDVFMPRPDYERLRELAGGACIAGSCCLLDWRHKAGRQGKPFMYYPFLKLIDLRTEVYAKDFSQKYYSGVWIDVFPLDGLPESEKATVRIFRRSWFWRQLFSLHFCKRIIAKGGIQKFLKSLMLPFAKMMNGDYLCRKLDLLSQKYDYDSASCIGGVINGYGPQEKIAKADIEPVQMEFEGGLFFGIKGYDVYLANLYHDYMELPPEEMRICHGFEAWRVDA